MKTIFKKVYLLLIFISVNVAQQASEKPFPEVSKNHCVVADKGSKLTGVIVDKRNNEPLVGVEVTLLDCNIKVLSDLDGKFEIENIIPGAHALKIDYISYQSKIENIYIKERDNTYVIRMNNSSY